jgi:hypothetical protein
MQRSEIRENPGFRPIGLHPGYKSFYTASKFVSEPPDDGCEKAALNFCSNEVRLVPEFEVAVV